MSVERGFFTSESASGLVQGGSCRVPGHAELFPDTLLLINTVDGFLFILLGMIQTCDASSFPDNL